MSELIANMSEMGGRSNNAQTPVAQSQEGLSRALKRHYQ